MEADEQNQEPYGNEEKTNYHYTQMNSNRNRDIQTAYANPERSFYWAKRRQKRVIRYQMDSSCVEECLREDEIRANSADQDSSVKTQVLEDTKRKFFHHRNITINSQRHPIDDEDEQFFDCRAGQYPRNLTTRDIEGAFSDTNKTPAVKNFLKLQESKSKKIKKQKRWEVKREKHIFRLGLRMHEARQDSKSSIPAGMQPYERDCQWIPTRISSKRPFTDQSKQQQNHLLKSIIRKSNDGEMGGMKGDGQKHASIKDSSSSSSASKQNSIGKIQAKQDKSLVETSNTEISGRQQQNYHNMKSNIYHNSPADLTAATTATSYVDTKNNRHKDNPFASPQDNNQYLNTKESQLNNNSAILSASQQYPSNEFIRINTDDKWEPKGKSKSINKRQIKHPEQHGKLRNQNVDQTEYPVVEKEQYNNFNYERHNQDQDQDIHDVRRPYVDSYKNKPVQEVYFHSPPRQNIFTKKIESSNIKETSSNLKETNSDAQERQRQFLEKSRLFQEEGQNQIGKIRKNHRDSDEKIHRRLGGKSEGSKRETKYKRNNGNESDNDLCESSYFSNVLRLPDEDDSWRKNMKVLQEKEKKREELMDRFQGQYQQQLDQEMARRERKFFSANRIALSQKTEYNILNFNKNIVNFEQNDRGKDKGRDEREGEGSIEWKRQQQSRILDHDTNHFNQGLYQQSTNVKITPKKQQTQLGKERAISMVNGQQQYRSKQYESPGSSKIVLLPFIYQTDSAELKPAWKDLSSYLKFSKSKNINESYFQHLKTSSAGTNSIHFDLEEAPAGKPTQNPDETAIFATPQKVKKPFQYSYHANTTTAKRSSRILNRIKGPIAPMNAAKAFQLFQKSEQEKKNHGMV